MTGPVLSLPASGRRSYFPAIACGFRDSPIDALVALCLRRDEATMLVTASWGGDADGCIVATLHGGRAIAALRLPDGQWAACNAFLDELFATTQEASWRLGRLLKRGRQGYVGYLRCAAAPMDGAAGPAA